MADALSLKTLLEKSKNKKGYSSTNVDDKWRSLSELKSLIDDQVVYRNKSNSTCTGHTRNLTLSSMDLKGVSDTIDKIMPCTCNSLANRACSCQSRTGAATCTCNTNVCDCVSRGDGISCICEARTRAETCTCNTQCTCVYRTAQSNRCICNAVCTGNTVVAHGNCTCNGANLPACDYVYITCWCDKDGGSTCSSVNYYGSGYQATIKAYLDEGCSCAFRYPVEKLCLCHVAKPTSIGCDCHTRTAALACTCNSDGCNCVSRTFEPYCTCVSRGSITCTCVSVCTCEYRTSAPVCPCNTVCNCNVQDVFNN